MFNAELQHPGRVDAGRDNAPGEMETRGIHVRKPAGEERPCSYFRRCVLHVIDIKLTDGGVSQELVVHERSPQGRGK